MAHNGQTAALAVYTAGQALPAGTTVASVTTGTVFTPGTYTASSSLNFVGGTVILNGGGNPNAVFTFQIGSTLVTASATSISCINGAQPQNVFWLVGSSATLGTTTTIAGNIIAQASITDNGGSTVDGTLVALTAAITLNDTTITVPVSPGPPRPSLQVHPHNDTANSVSTANATNLATAETLANALKTAINAHMANVSTPSVIRINVIDQ